jgi:hypothetical protein
LGKVIHGTVCIEDKAAGSDGLWKAGMGWGAVGQFTRGRKRRQCKSVSALGCSLELRVFLERYIVMEFHSLNEIWAIAFIIWN